MGMIGAFVLGLALSFGQSVPAAQQPTDLSAMASLSRRADFNFNQAAVSGVLKLLADVGGVELEIAPAAVDAIARRPRTDLQLKNA